MVIDFIIEKVTEPFLLIGNSLGGHLAIEILPELPQCKGLVIFGTPPLKKPINAEEAFLPCEALNTYFKADYTDDELDETMAVATYGPAGRELLRDDFIQTDPSFRSTFYNGAMVEGSLHDEVAIIASDSRPVYVIQGVQDPTVNVNYIRGLQGITKIFEINKCGHYASLEEPYQFNSILKKVSSEVFKA
jgi:pimeloyl-ACP methyl ester carboxylesterase